MSHVYSMSKSIVSMSNSDRSQFLESITPSKIFKSKQTTQFEPVLNQKISTLTDAHLFRYTSDLDAIVSVLKDREIAQYQQRLIAKAIKSISPETVDVDKMQLGLKVTDTDFRKLIDPEKGLERDGVKERQRRFSVSELKVGNKNKGFKRSDRKPYFDLKYRFVLDKDEYRFIEVFLATPDHVKNVGRDLPYNLEIDFIPTRFTLEQISFLLYQIQSVLGPRRYEQLLMNSLVLRFDTGYVMYGVSQLFSFMSTSNNKVAVGHCYPKIAGTPAQTVYVGALRSNHTIGYDKWLKECRFFIDECLSSQYSLSFDRIAPLIKGWQQWYEDHPCSFRLESRQKVINISDAPLLNDIEDVPIGLADLRLFKPQWVYRLPTVTLERLVKDKSLLKVNFAFKALAKRREVDFDDMYYQFDTTQLQEAFSEKITALKMAILNPTKLAYDDQWPNYSESAMSAYELLKPHFPELRAKSDDPIDIIKSKARHIYVEGCAGAGKTTLMVDRVMWLRDPKQQRILGKTIIDDEICVVTYTKAARLVFKKALHDKSKGESQVRVRTFSAWCRHLLTYVFDEEVKFLEPKNAAALLEQVINAVVKRRRAKELITAKVMQDLISHAKGFSEPSIESSIQKLMPELIRLKDQICEVADRYKQLKDADNYYDYDDFITEVALRVKTKSNAKAVVAKYKYLLLDEAQDTNAPQWEIIKSLVAAGMSFFCVGDPAQSIFQFRGAVSAELNTFKEHFVDSEKYHLTLNRRSTQPICELANFVRYLLNPKYQPMHSNKVAKSEVPRLVQAQTLQSALGWLVDDLKAKLKASALGSVLICCRFNAQVKTVLSALTNAGICTDDDIMQEGDVLTIHKVKGDEAQTVYVLDPRFSRYKVGTKKEELCAMFVAITRAKKSLTIIKNDTNLVKYKDAQPRDEYVLDCIPEKLVEFKRV